MRKNRSTATGGLFVGPSTARRRRERENGDAVGVGGSVARIEFTAGERLSGEEVKRRELAHRLAASDGCAPHRVTVGALAVDGQTANLRSERVID